MARAEIPRLWRDYLFLTKEMAKFLDRHDLEMFFTLMDQRGQLQTMIDEAGPYDFDQTPDGRALLSTIRNHDMAIVVKLQTAFNAARQQQTAAVAYQGLGGGEVGVRMDSRR